ncbi:MAG: hypothetical protein FWC00_05295 [Firmicutes bacterium]|nr:hypothetical protein [Bacillota bacterium]
MDKDPDLASRWLNGQLIDARLKYLDMVNRKTAIAIGLIKPGVEVSSKPETMAL